MKVLVFLEQREGVLKSSAFEALSVASELTAGNSANVAGLLIGSKNSDLAKELDGYGADVIYNAESSELGLYNVFAYADAMAAAVESFKPDVVLGVASPMGRDLFPRVAAKVNAGLLTDLIELDQSGEFKGGTKPMYAGKVLADVEFQNCSVKMATIRPNVFPAKKSQGKATLTPLSVEFKADLNRLKTVELRKGESSKTDLTEAGYIISGGRAMGSSDNFKILHECAQTIGATVGASRAAVDSGYAGHDMQVGQTGKTVNPNLYVACGISGSIQHMAGMRTSKVIVAINTDPDAPIFSVADYGIVADLFEAVPVLTKQLAELPK